MANKLKIINNIAFYMNQFQTKLFEVNEYSLSKLSKMINLFNRLIYYIYILYIYEYFNINIKYSYK